MYYPDLTCYRINFSYGYSLVSPNLRNIGWLGRNQDFPKGKVPEPIIQKLKEILFLANKNAEDISKGTFDVNKATLLHTSSEIRGSVYKCRLCLSEHRRCISIAPLGLRYYTGNSPFELGRNDIRIPSLKKDVFYVFPTMLYHYIVEHNYRPPQEFLDAFDLIDLEKPFNLLSVYQEDAVLKMRSFYVDKFVPELEDANEYVYDEDEDEDEDEICIMDSEIGEVVRKNFIVSIIKILNTLCEDKISLENSLHEACEILSEAIEYFFVSQNTHNYIQISRWLIRGMNIQKSIGQKQGNGQITFNNQRDSLGLTHAFVEACNFLLTHVEKEYRSTDIAIAASQLNQFVKARAK
jgi:hypothetical protein